MSIEQLIESVYRDEESNSKITMLIHNYLYWAEPEDREDVFHSSVENLLKGKLSHLKKNLLDRFDPQHIMAYWYAIARNECRSFIKHRQRRARLFASTSNENLQRIFDRFGADLHFYQLLHEILEMRKDLLSEQEAKVLELILTKETSNKNISYLLDISASQVSTIKTRIRKKLTKEIQRRSLK